jgi:MoaA/NifB/PqqE/SkfB family radical SAM enzyme
MGSDAYSPHKIVRHLDVIQNIRAGVPARPVHVQLIISDTCNQACRFCAYRNPDYSSSKLFYEVRPGKGGLRRSEAHPERDYNPRRMIDWEKIREILLDCKEMGVSGLQLTGGGEPTVHPQFLYTVELAQKLDLAVAVVSNGVQIGKKLAQDERFLGLFGRVSWSRISIDAGDHESYSRVRHVPPDHFDSAWQAVTRLREASDASRLAHKPVVGVGYVVTPDNWQGVLAGTQRARDAGAHNIRISAEFTVDGTRHFDGFRAQAAALAREAELVAGPDFQVYNRFSEKLEDLRQGQPDYQRCHYQEVTTYIGGDLNVYRCCVQSYNPTGLVGSLKEMRFRDLWMAEDRAREMEQFDARGCERCQFNTINRNLAYALGAEGKQHEEFP